MEDSCKKQESQKQEVVEDHEIKQNRMYLKDNRTLKRNASNFLHKDFVTKTRDEEKVGCDKSC